MLLSSKYLALFSRLCSSFRQPPLVAVQVQVNTDDDYAGDTLTLLIDTSCYVRLSLYDERWNLPKVQRPVTMGTGELIIKDFAMLADLRVGPRSFGSVVPAAIQELNDARHQN
jgi:hypothetical protein